MRRSGLFCLILICSSFTQTLAQTEGDTGYNYEDAYDNDVDDGVLGMEPKFQVAVQNVTVVEGQNAVLPCTIENLGKYKTTWTDPFYNSLTFDDRSVIDDSRFTIDRPYTKEWNLRINDVTWQDQGIYRCTVNTDPPKHKIVNLHVKVPPKIIDELSSDDVRAREGEMVMLTCNVTGVPHPDVTWYRREVGRISAPRELIENAYTETILIQNLTRHCDYIYECRASNGVEPDDIRLMKVTVQYPPEVRLNNAKLYQQVGKTTVLICDVSANPQGQINWEKDGHPITSDERHRLVLTNNEGKSYSLSLEIGNLQTTDFGRYKCVAANGLGTSEKAMRLIEYKPRIHTQPPPPRRPPSTTFDIHFVGYTTTTKSSSRNIHAETKPSPQVNSIIENEITANRREQGSAGDRVVVNMIVFVTCAALTVSLTWSRQL